MNKKLTLGVVVIVLAVLAGIAIFMRGSLKEVGLKVVEKSKQIAESATSDSGPQPIREALADLAKEITVQEASLKELRLKQEKDSMQLSRDQELLAKHEVTVKDLYDRVRQAGAREISIDGKTYTQDAATAKLRELVSAVTDEQTKIKAQEDNLAVLEKQARDIETAVEVVRKQTAKLQKNGKLALQGRSAAELKALSQETRDAIVGMKPNTPLAYGLKRVSDLLSELAAQ